MKMKLGILFSVIFSLLVQQSHAQNYDWAHKIGLTSADQAKHAVTDASGNFYVVGSFQGTSVDFNPDPDAAAVNNLSASNADGFVAKYSSTGVYQWAFRLGGSLADEVTAVYADGSFVYIIGKYQGAFVDFDPGAGTVNLPNNGNTDVFIAKYNAIDGSYVWAKSLGGASQDEGLAITADPSGNVYSTGAFQGTDVDFDPGAGTVLRTSSGVFDIYILKLNSSGDFVYATTVGSTGNDKATGIAVDASSNAYITGQFFGTVDFNPDGATTNNLTELLSGDAFIAQYNSTGGYGWAFALSGNGADQGNAIITDGTNIVVTGSYSSTIATDFDPGAGSQTSISNGGTSDIFIAKYTNAGAYVAHKSIGGSGIDRGFALAKDATGDIYITGSFNNTVDFDPGASTNSHTANGEDAFVGRYDSNLNHEFAFKIGGTTVTTDQGLGIGVNSLGSVYVAGAFSQTVDFDPTAGTQELTSGGSTDIFFAKYCIPPSVSTPPDQEYCAGADVTFTVTASGPGTFTYLWKKGAATVSNGGRISGATTASLSIADVVAGDAGSYTVEVGNGCAPNVTSSVIPLVVNSPPSISVHPVTPAAKCVGESFDVSVTAGGTGTLSYQWKRGTTNVGTNSSSLSINPIAADDAGSYTVVVSGACAPAATSNAAVLTVNTPPSISVHPVTPAAKCVGDAFNVSVTASGTGPLSYQWKRGTTNVGTNSSSLSINPVATGDAGNYTVVVSGACTPAATSNAAVLTVNVCTGITSAMENFVQVYPNPSTGRFTLDISQLDGENVKLSVMEANGYEVWTRTILNVNGTLKENIDLSALEAGMYVLRIENSDHTLIRRIMLTK